MKNELILEIFRKSANSNNTVRWATLILIVSSVVAILSFYNSLTGNWTDSRITLHENMWKWHKDFPSDAIKIAENDKTDYERAKTYFIKRRYTDETLHSALMELRKKEIENVISLTIPFFKIEVDINDLGLVSGMGFLILLGVLYFSLTLKLMHLKIIGVIIEKHRAKGEALFLSTLTYMNQIFSVPQVGEGKGPSLINEIADNLCLLPVTIYTIIFLNDARTLRVAQLFGLEVTIVSFVLSAIFLTFITYMTYKVKSIISEIQFTWQQIPNISGIL